MEKPPTYLFSLEDRRELARLSLQDHLFNETIPRFPPLFVPTRGSIILDVASGTGGWVLQVAEAFKEASVIGVDKNVSMIQYSRAQAEARKLAAQFRPMDIQHMPWHFPDSYFSLVNARFISGCFEVSTWTPFLRECYRVLKPGGIFRSVEAVHLASPLAESVTEVKRQTYSVMKKRGVVFSEHDMAVAPVVAKLLRQSGFEDITLVPYVLDLSYGSSLHKAVGQTFRMANELLKLLVMENTQRTLEDIENLYRRYEEEWESADFVCHWFLVSVSGVKR